MSRETERRLAKLDALEAGGVDNWEWYDDALAEWHKENNLDESIDDAIEDINDLLVEANVSEPAGTGEGYCIDIDEDSLHALLKKMIEDNNG